MNAQKTLKPYLIDSVYSWCVDNGMTPYILVFVNEHTQVPMQFVQDHHIVLNISPQACQKLQIQDDFVSFTARFGGKPMDIWIPTGHIVSIYSKETSEGTGFEPEIYDGNRENDGEKSPEAPEKLSALKLVKK